MSRTRSTAIAHHIDLELIVWICGLAWLALINPDSGTHFRFCILKRLGVSWCPGCGLGHSISYIFHGDLLQSFRAHPLGIPALAILLARVAKLLNLYMSQMKAKLYRSNI